MADPFVAEIRMVGFNFAPRGWAMCNGQLLPIAQNTALFSLLGTTYGGDGRSTFALPDLQNRAAMHPGQGPGLSQHDLGESGGSASQALISAEIPAHAHGLKAVAAPGTSTTPVNSGLARAPGTAALYGAASTINSTLAPSAINTSGGSAEHNNMQPYLVMNFIIALQGVFPPRS